MALEGKILPQDLSPDAAIGAEIQARLTEGKLSCAGAFAVAQDLGRDPLDVGQTADALGVRLSRCQLGLFGYPGKLGWQAGNVAEKAVPQGIEAAVRAACGTKGHLTCASAWQVAAAFGVPRMQIGWIAEGLGIRITACQLGAF